MIEKNMLIRLLVAFCSVLLLCELVCADGEHEVKRGVFPFLAFLYYPDEAVMDASGARFLRSAILIRPGWLISSAIDHSVIDNIPLGFPRKTLLARLGAISIDVNFTLSEDENEQEREIIQIVRPTIHNLDVWYFTDITLLKTLVPFDTTPAVSATKISQKRDYVDKNCMILVFAKKYGNSTNDKILMQLPVELLPPSIDTCGTQFSGTSMTCAMDGEESKRIIHDPEFCQGNSGGPLLCEGEVMGLQTYIDNSCKQPHLYQLISAWDAFISCAIQEKCHLEYCDNICIVSHKDPPANNETTLSSKAFSFENESKEATVNLTESTETTTSSKSEEPETSELKPSFRAVTDQDNAANTSSNTIIVTTTITQNPETTPESHISKVPVRSDEHPINWDVRSEETRKPNIEAQLESQEKKPLGQRKRAHPPSNSAVKRVARLIQTLFLSLFITSWVL